MKGRDVALLAALAAVAAVAALDAVRGGGGQDAEPVETESPPPPADASPAPEGPPAVLLPVPATGTLVFTTDEDCRVRAARVTTGFELELPRLAGDCTLWAPPAGSRIAYGLGGRNEAGATTVPFRLVDLARPERPLGAFRALFGFLAWSRDGSRAAWCGASRTGFDLALGDAVRRLEDCPSAYTPDGRVAFAQGDRLVVDGRTVIRTRGTITFARWGADGSLAVVIEGERVERWAAGVRTDVLDLPPWLEGRLPALSPDNCAAFFTRPTRIDLLDVGCFEGDAPRAFFDDAAAWSPDGRWLAVAEAQTIAFHRVVGRRDVERWLVAARDLAWLDS